MEEKVLASSRSIKQKDITAHCLGILAVVLCIAILYYFLDINGVQHKRVAVPNPFDPSADLLISEQKIGFMDYLISALLWEGRDTAISIVLSIGILLLIWRLVTHYKYKDMSLTVTDRRIYGVSSFGKRVDFPLNSVSSVAASGKQDITILTSSGKFLFGNFENAGELFQCISDLLAGRQG